MIKLKDLLKEDKKKYYHASPHKFKPGYILSISYDKKSSSGATKDGVFITFSKFPHITINSTAINEKWYVYEVDPIGKISRAGNGEWVVNQAEIISIVGRISPGNNLAKKYSNDNRTTKYSKRVTKPHKNQGLE